LAGARIAADVEALRIGLGREQLIVLDGDELARHVPMGVGAAVGATFVLPKVIGALPDPRLEGWGLVHGGYLRKSSFRERTRAGICSGRCLQRERAIGAKAKRTPKPHLAPRRRTLAL